jgi:catechol 2,3-dioxygenase
MTTNRLPAETALGYIFLTVSNLDRVVDFYQNSLGMHLHWRDGQVAGLGAGQQDLLRLIENPTAGTTRRTTGLYHFALLTPSRLELARVLRQLIQTETPLQGFSDHGVSEAIYLADPDGNGIEVYRDRPREEWPFENGKLVMGVDPLDIQALLAELNGTSEEWAGLDPLTSLGHVHLHVAELPAAESFYRDVIGFELMQRFGSQASFLSAGGYHHHLGINTWAGVGAPQPPQNSIGLRWYVIVLPSQASLDRIVARALETGVPIQERDAGVHLQDPSGNGILLTLAGV